MFSLSASPDTLCVPVADPANCVDSGLLYPCGFFDFNKFALSGDSTPI